MHTDLGGSSTATTVSKANQSSSLDLTIRSLTEKLDQAGITGPLRSTFIQNASHILNLTIGPGAGIMNKMAYPIALETYGEGFRTFRQAVQMEFNMASPGLQKFIDQARTSGVDENKLVNVVVSFNSLKIAAASFGVAGIFGSPNTANRTLEGHNVAKAKQLTPNLRFSIRLEENAPLIAITDEDKVILKLKITDIEDDLLRVFSNIEEQKKALPKQLLESLPVLLKASLDHLSVICISAASHLAGIPGALNARGNLLKYDEAHKSFQLEDKFTIGAALSKLFAEVQATTESHKLGDIPPLAIVLGGEPK